MSPKNEWDILKFADFCERFKNQNTKNVDYEPLSVTKDNGLVLQSEKFNKRIANKNTNKYLIIKRNEFAYDPMSLYYGAIGRQKVIEKGIISPAYITFNINQTLVNADYFDQFIHSDIAQHNYVKKTEGGNKHGKRKKTDWKAFCSIKLAFPPLPEQKKIAAILSSVDEAIEATEAVIEQTRTVKKGLLQELLTRGIGHTEFKKTAIGEIPKSWKVNKLGDVAPFQTGYPFKSNEFSQQGDRLLRGSNVGVGTINWSEDNTCFFPTTRRDEFRQYLLKDGDVVIGMDRPFISDGFKTAQIQKNDLPALLLQRVGRFLPNSNEILLDFVGLLAESEFVQGYLQKTQKGMDLPHISKSEIENCLVPMPPKNEQIKIVNQISSTKNSIKQNNNSLTQYYQLKNGLLQDLLTGKVRVNTLDLPALLNAEAPAEAQAE